jgi:plasmid maintenance system killer protein
MPLGPSMIADTVTKLRARCGNSHWLNDQYRLCFRWTNEGPTDVELVDYH